VSDHELRDGVLAKLERPLPGWLVPLLVALAVVGGGSFLILLLGRGSDRAWHAFFVNWLFWTGLSQAGVVFSASQILSNAHWSHPVRRIAEASVAFLPVAFLLFVVLWFGRAHVFPWVAAPVEEWPKGWWLRDWFVFLRDGAALLVLFGLSFWYIYHSLRPDAALLASRPGAGSGRLRGWLARGWTWAGGAQAGDVAQIAHSQQRLAQVGAAIAVVYVLVLSLVAFDLVMSLAPHWLSNLLGGYLAVAAWLMALMVLALTTIFWRRHLGLEALIGSRTMHDLGKLCFAFTVFWMYFFFSQFIVIWYGNLPEETQFIQMRLGTQFLQDTWFWDASRLDEPYVKLSLTAWAGCWVIPFWVLLGQAPKRTPAVLGSVACIVLLGFWLERNALVWPSLVPQDGMAWVGPIQVGIALGFLGAFALVNLVASRVFPTLPLPTRD